MSGTELDPTIGCASTEEPICGERPAFCSPLQKGRPIMSQPRILKGGKYYEQWESNIECLAVKPYSTNLSAFMDRLLLHDSHNEVELNWTWLLSCPRRSETFCFKFIISASAAATSSRSALVYYQQKEKKKSFKWRKTLSISIARFRKGYLGVYRWREGHLSSSHIH